MMFGRMLTMKIRDEVHVFGQFVEHYIIHIYLHIHKPM